MAAITDTAPAASLAVPYSSIPKKPVHWFWKGFIPFRHVTLIIGPGGTSKGITTIELAARMTRHDLAPGEHGADELYDGPGDVILIAPEDDPNETVAWRLSAAGAIPDRVHNLTVLPDGNRFGVPTDIPSITQAIREIEFDADDQGQRTIPRYAADGKPRKVGMVIMDPLLALAETEMTRRGQARPVMEALEDVARHNDIVILLTHHTNADGKAAGSRGITETVRNQITLSRLPRAPEDSPVRLFTVTKTNIGITGAVQRYVLAGPVEEPHVMWTCEAPPGDVSRGYDVAPAPAPVLGERYRASFLTGNGKPQVIGDYATDALARIACRGAAPAQLHWHPISGQPGMTGAALTDRATGVTSYYSVLDRHAKAAAESGSRAS